jgi:hypothetical protein
LRHKEPFAVKTVRVLCGGYAAKLLKGLVGADWRDWFR